MREQVWLAHGEKHMATTQDPLVSNPTGAIGNDQSAKDKVKARLEDAAGHLKQTAGEYGRSAAEHIDRNMHSAAGAVKSTAETLRSQSGGEGKVAGMAGTAAVKLDRTAEYLEHFDTRELLGQAESWTRRNPALAICSALAVGFVIGMSLKRDDDSY